jgi:putative endonuclease
MSDPRRALGAEGEDRAAAHLVRHGYRILDRNTRAAGVEIDLVARQRRTIAFIEVKTRRSRSHGPPESAVYPRKQRRLARAAAAWLHTHHHHALTVRFAVIACEPDPSGNWHIHHIENAFEAGD